MSQDDPIGAIAILRSGGPAMTVYRMPSSGPSGSESIFVETEWFDAAGHLQRDRFDRRELVILPKAQP